MNSRKRTENLTLLLFAGLVMFSAPRFLQPERSVNLWEQLKRIFGEFFPLDFSVLPEVLVAFRETIEIATMSTLLAMIGSLFLAIAGSRFSRFSLGRWLVRFILAAIRSIPSLVWAVLAVALVGASARAGLIALAFYSVGYLGKFFVDTLDQADPAPATWLRSQGASPWQIFQYGIWPQLRASLIGHSLWMWEYNVRSAAIIGYVGAGGLGLQLHIYQEYGQWNRFSVVLLLIFLVVFLLQSLSDRIKTESQEHRH